MKPTHVVTAAKDARGSSDMERRPCVNFDTCPLRSSKRGCFEDVHHYAYPKRDYQTTLEKEFRELDENKVRICRQEHNDIPALESPPRKPDLETMQRAVARVAMQDMTD